MVLPFGPVNAPATFQGYINEQPQEYLDINANAFVDYFLANTSVSEESHWKIVRSVLAKLENAGYFLNIHKYELLYKEVKCQGFITKAGSISIDADKV